MIIIIIIRRHPWAAPVGDSRGRHPWAAGGARCRSPLYAFSGNAGLPNVFKPYALTFRGGGAKPKIPSWPRPAISGGKSLGFRVSQISRDFLLIL